MRIFIIFIITVALMIPAQIVFASPYGKNLCRSGQYKCVTIQRGQTWESLFPNTHQRDVVKRLNRTNQALRTGSVIAVPNTLFFTSIMDISPFAHRIQPTGKRTIVVNLKKLAWGAYNEDGRLIRWGPASGGKNYCADVRRGCRTAIGNFSVYRKHGAGCKSTKFPIGRGGAPMPYCMFFRGGFAMHGSPQVPGYNASHGCVRLFTEDARWLNQNFVSFKNPTKVVVLPY
ncbi:MAG: L,D-transpeptidase [Gammaproteobacteria bacterium]